MWILLLGVAWICCLIIAQQDFRHREIHVAPLIVFGILGGLIHWREWGSIFWQHLIANVVVVGLLLGSILLYFRLRGDHQVMDVKLGWGDIVMLLCLASWLEPLPYLILYCACTSLLTLVYGMLRQARQIDAQYPIPLAGWLAIAFVGWSIYSRVG